MGLKAARSWIRRQRGVSGGCCEGAWIGSLAEHWQSKHTRLNRLRTCANAVSDLKWFRGDGVHVTRRDETRRSPFLSASLLELLADEEDDRSGIGSARHRALS